MQKRKWSHKERKQWIKDNGKIFYCNKEDTAIFVKKWNDIGWTFNWGNPWSYVITIVLVTILRFVIFS